jgi:hypothetical protein
MSTLWSELRQQALNIYRKGAMFIIRARFSGRETKYQTVVNAEIILILILLCVLGIKSSHVSQYLGLLPDVL